jgi:hypothetical protein
MRKRYLRLAAVAPGKRPAPSRVIALVACDSQFGAPISELIANAHALNVSQGLLPTQDLVSYGNGPTVVVDAEFIDQDFESGQGPWDDRDDPTAARIRAPPTRGSGPTAVAISGDRDRPTQGRHGYVHRAVPTAASASG